MGMLVLASDNVCYIDTTATKAGSSSDLDARSEQLKTERQSLPVRRARRSLLKRLNQLRGFTAIIIGETGSGKTTQIPQVLSCFFYAVMFRALLSLL